MQTLEQPSIDRHASAIRELPWFQRVSLARVNRVLAPEYIASIRDEATALAAHRYADWRATQAVADACDAYLRFVDAEYDGTDELDELDALLVDDDADTIRLDDHWRDSHHAIRAGMGEGM